MFENPCVAIRQVSEKSWELLEDLRYVGSTDSFTVPAGFKTDFASVPRVASWLIPTYGLYTPSAILHDHFWVYPTISWADIDGIFRRTLREAGVSFPKRWMMWAAVRLGSRFRDISFTGALKWLAVAIPSVVLLGPVMLLVQVWLVAFWLIEMLFWGIGRLLGRKRPRPVFEFQVTT